MREYRLYTFTNFYLSSIQQGVQTQHAASELYNKYLWLPPENVMGSPEENEMYNAECLYTLKEWSLNHKTTILLNGGNNDGIIEALGLCENLSAWYEDPRLPFAPFYEDDQSLDGIITSVAIVLPNEIWDAKNFQQMKRSDEEFSKWYSIADHGEDWFYRNEDGTLNIFGPESDAAKFLQFMKSCPLAR